MMWWTVLVLVVAVSGCALDSAQVPAASPSTATEVNITGVIGADAQLEGGCVWLDTDRGRIEPLWPVGYTVTPDPLTLLDPQGERVAGEGDSITVTGRPSPDTATICQVGEVWSITDVAAVGAG